MLHKEILLKDYAFKFINISLSIARESTFPVVNTVVDREHPKLVIGDHVVRITREKDASICCELIMPDGSGEFVIATYEEALEEAIGFAKARFPNNVDDLNELFEFTPVIREVTGGNVQNIIELSWQFALMMIAADVQRAWDNPFFVGD